jgi:hypothetical protein
MSVNEIVSSCKDELVSSRKPEIVLEVPVILPLPRGKCKPRKVKAKAKKVHKVKGPGRPPVYGKGDRRRVAAALKRHGLTKGMETLADKGLKISLTLANSVAKEYGIKFTCGRPKAA